MGLLLKDTASEGCRLGLLAGKFDKRLKWVSVETDSEEDSSLHPKTAVSASVLLSLLGSPVSQEGLR